MSSINNFNPINMLFRFLCKNREKWEKSCSNTKSLLKKPHIYERINHNFSVQTWKCRALLLSSSGWKTKLHNRVLERLTQRKIEIPFEPRDSTGKIVFLSHFHFPLYLLLSIINFSLNKHYALFCDCVNIKW